MEKYKLWENGTPGFVSEYGQDEPSLTPYLLENGKKNTCIIVCPGGGYMYKAEHEDGVIAEMLNEKGISAFTLDYRVEPYKHPYITEDLLRAIRYVRYNAEKFSIDPEKIGVLGFSAGGHLVSSSMHLFDYGKEGDEIDAVSSRPDFAVLCYPVVTLGELTHAGSRKRLIAGLENEDELAKALSLELNVRDDTPPAFIWHTMSDAAVDARNSLHLASAMRAKSIPCEIHVFQNGSHGLGLARKYEDVKQWIPLFEMWMKINNFL